MTSTYSYCTKKLLTEIGAPKIAIFFLPCYFLSVGMAKCDITRGRGTCTGCIGENRASNVMMLIQGMSIIIFHSFKTYATTTIVIQRGNNGGQPTLTSYFCSSIIKE